MLIRNLLPESSFLCKRVRKRRLLIISVSQPESWGGVHSTSHNSGLVSSKSEATAVRQVGVGKV